MSYEHHELSGLQGLSHRQGSRINARLQAAMNHALQCELDMGIGVDFLEIDDGVINGFAGILTQVHINAMAASSQSSADELTRQIVRGMEKVWSQNRKDYLAKAQFAGRVLMNPHEAGRS